MRPSQIWFGTSEHPLAGRYHLPEDRLVRGAIVLCPAFGMEAACSGPSQRELASELVRVGFAVLRFDYDGTGDSAGSDEDPDRVAAWLGSIRHAVAFLRGEGHNWVGLVGLRLGATLAATEAKNGGVDAVALWDPCLSARAFLREQRLLLNSFVHEPELGGDASYGPGITFTRETVVALADVTLTSAVAEVSAPVLLLTRAESRESAKVAVELDAPNLQWSEIFGQPDLVGVEPALSRIPHETLQRIASWFEQQPAQARYEVASKQSSTAVVSRTTDGAQIREYPVVFGNDEVFGIVTEPEVIEHETSFIFINAGVLDHIGPSRLWVELSRRWAALGFRSIRFDLSGIGESPVHPGINDRATRSVHALREVADAITFISPKGPSEAVLVGLCSGAYHAMEVGFASKVRAVYMVNPAFRVDPLLEPDASEEIARREIAEVRRKWYVALENLEFLWPIARKAPEFMWVLIDRFGVTSSKADTLLRLAERGIDTFIVADLTESSRYIRGKRSQIRHLELGGALSLVTFESLDHTVFGPLARQRVVAALSQHLAASLLGVTVASADA